MTRLFFSLGCFSLLFLAGCCSLPRKEAINPPYAVIESATLDAEQDPLFEPTDKIASDWWSMFEDPQLDCLIRTAFALNPNFQKTQANILLAKANADRYRSALFPNVTWGGDISRQKLSTTGVIPFSGISVPVIPGFNIPEYFTLYETQLNLTFDFDIWKKNRNRYRAALSEVQARIVDSIFSRLALGINVAAVYFQLQIDFKRKEVAQKLIENRKTYQQLVESRKTGGLDTATTYNTRQFNVAQADQSLLQIEADIAVNTYQLNYLTGNFEETVCKSSIAELPLPKVPLPRELPLHLISSRPDITAQIWLIESAGRGIEVAKASFYPDFNITGLFGFQTIHFKELFRWDSAYYNVDPAFTLPVFDAGAILADIHGNEVNYDLAVLDYNNLVLNAAKEVLDGFAVLRNNNQQLKAYKEQTTFQEKNLQLSELRFQYQVNSALDYLTSQESVLLAKDQELVSLGNTLQSILSLIRALGGGFDACCCDDDLF